MTAQKLAAADSIAAVPIRRILEGLARIHRWIVVVDEQRRVAWFSEALRELPGMRELAVGVDARSFLAKLPKPEQVFPLRSSLRERTQITGSPLELRIPDGRTLQVDIDIVRIDSRKGDLLIAVATEHVASADGIESALLDALSDAVLAVDAGGFVRRANPAAMRLLEATPNQVLARSVTALLAQGAEQIDAFTQVLQGAPRDAVCELSRRSKSGRLRFLEVRVAPISGGARARWSCAT